MSDHLKVAFQFSVKWCENGYSSSILLRCATVHYPSTKQSKYSNSTVITLKYLEENQEIPFYHHCQACLIHYFDPVWIPLLTHVIQCRIQVRPGYINQLRLVWPRQNVTWWLVDLDDPMTQSGFNPDVAPPSNASLVTLLYYKELHI